MNSKEENIDRLYKARTAHIQWMNYVKLLISGLNVTEKPPAPIAQESLLGEWFYNEALHFAQFNCKQTLDDMEALIESIYNHYTKIYSIYFGKKQGGMMQSLFGIKNSASKYELELASRYYEDILFFSDQLKKKFALLERQFFALSLEQHESVYIFGKQDRSETVAQPLIQVEEEKSYSHGPRSH
ncbi:MAG: hypothetical protein IE885_02050 [Campylobacterales bacterium]|nr:hypothetical protein [Campylobacterales bacterium]